MSLLRVENLHVHYGSIHAIKDISFEVNEGEIVTLIGANGAGKSTALNTVAGLMRATSGGITFEDGDITGTPAHKILEKGMALCPEGRRIFLEMSVQENLEMGGFTRPSSEIADSIEGVYDRFPRLKERYKQRAGTLSGGEQQMLAMGRALMSKPKLLMLDEPSLGLAPIIVEEIFNMIEKVRKAGTTVLLIEQNASIALQISDYAYAIELGRISLSGTGQELLNSEDVKRVYLGM